VEISNAFQIEHEHEHEDDLLRLCRAVIFCEREVLLIVEPQPLRSFVCSLLTVSDVPRRFDASRSPPDPDFMFEFSRRVFDRDADGLLDLGRSASQVVD
jgi:hypothetical protein